MTHTVLINDTEMVETIQEVVILYPRFLDFSIYHCYIPEQEAFQDGQLHTNHVHQGHYNQGHHRNSTQNR